MRREVGSEEEDGVVTEGDVGLGEGSPGVRFAGAKDRRLRKPEEPENGPKEEERVSRSPVEESQPELLPALKGQYD